MKEKNCKKLFVVGIILIIVFLITFSKDVNCRPLDGDCYQFLREADIFKDKKDGKIVIWPYHMYPEIEFKFDESIPSNFYIPIKFAMTSWNTVFKQLGIPLEFNLKANPNSKNIISLGPMPKGYEDAYAISLCGSFVFPCDNYLCIKNPRIIFNAAETWSTSITTDIPAGTVDVQAVATHELGHWLGLADIGNEMDEYDFRKTCKGKSVMCYATLFEGLFKRVDWLLSLRTPGIGDINGLKALYLPLKFAEFYTQSNSIEVKDNKGGPSYGIYIAESGTAPSGTPVYGIIKSGTIPLALKVDAPITSTATSNTTDSKAFGIFQEYSNFRPISSLMIYKYGDISVTANSKKGEAYAGGIYLGLSESEFVKNWYKKDFEMPEAIMGVFKNRGDIYISSNSDSEKYASVARGIYVGGRVGGYFSNEGNVHVTAVSTPKKCERYCVGGLWWGCEAVAKGVWTGSIGDYFENTGNISATAYGYWGDVQGVWITGPIGGNFSNTGTIFAEIIATEEAYADGVTIEGGEKDAYIKGDFINTGKIFAQAIANKASATGVWVDNEIRGNFINKGEIGAEAIGKTEYADACGVDLYKVNNFINVGYIIAKAQIDNGTIEKTAGVGIIGDPPINIGNVINRNEIFVSAKGGENATIRYIGGLSVEMVSQANIINTGTISVNIDAPKAKSVGEIAGIYIGDSQNVIISNPGSILLNINTSPSITKHIRTLLIENSNVTLKDKFAITFGLPGIDLNMRPIYVSSNSTLNLNNTDLIAKVYSSRLLKFGTKYYLIENKGTVKGEWRYLSGDNFNPDIFVDWAGEDKGANSAVIFKYIPASKGPILLAMGSTGSSVVSKNMVNLILTPPSTFIPLIFGEEKPIMLASADKVSIGIPTHYNRGLFFIPFYTRVDADDLGFDANAYGGALGIEGKLTKNLFATLYGGYSYVDLDFNVLGPKKENQDLYMGGLSLNYVPKPYFVRFWVAPHYANHDYIGRTGANYELKEKADYKSWGVDTELTGGYIFERGNIFIAPEIGLGYTYYKAEDFHTKVPEAPQWNRYYKPDKVDFFKGILGMYIGGRDKEKKVLFYGSLRLEQALGENDVSVISYLQGLPRYKLEKDISDTTITAQAGLNLKLGKQWMLEFVGRGDFNADYNAYTAQAILRYSF
jgi:hypothetical protein